MGIAIVIPTNKVLEVLNQEHLSVFRKEQDEIERLRKAATPDETT